MYQTFATRIQDLVGTAVTDNNALTEWLTEEAANAINIMSPEMLISASSTHRMGDAEQLNNTTKSVQSTIDSSTTTLVLNSGSPAHMKVGSILAFKSGSDLMTERVKVTTISGTSVKIQRAVNGTTAASITGGWNIYVSLEKTFNTRKFKLLEVNRDGMSARLISSGLNKQSLDSSSIHYVTANAPAYFIKSGNIHIRPYVKDYEQGEIIGLTYPVVKYSFKSTTDLPIECEDFIVIGAARKYLIRSMYEEFAQLPAGITIPAVGGTATDLTTMEDLDTDNTIDDHADQIEYDQWFATATHLIEGEEDVELASAQLQKIGTYLQAHQEELATKNTVFSSALQRASTKYNWFMTQYDKLTLMYNEKAQILRGVQA
tara:strand:+ start:1824 stop:2945 length:1122 start_codon:yes stop_codon:yes gene_type:complete